MDVYAIRLRKLAVLEREAGTAAELARRAGKQPSQLSAYKKAAKDQRGKPRMMGSSFARDLERAMSKPRGWMDQPEDETGDAVADAAAPAYLAPELSTEEQAILRAWRLLPPHLRLAISVLVFQCGREAIGAVAPRAAGSSREPVNLDLFHDDDYYAWERQIDALNAKRPQANSIRKTRRGA